MTKAVCFFSTSYLSNYEHMLEFQQKIKLYHFVKVTTSGFYLEDENHPNISFPVTKQHDTSVAVVTGLRVGRLRNHSSIPGRSTTHLFNIRSGRF
jgi:hypothetical protein